MADALPTRFSAIYPCCLEHIRADGSKCEIWTTKIRTKQGSTSPVFVDQAIRNGNASIVPTVIREVEIWRVAVLMVNRYADEAEANSSCRAQEARWDG